MTEQVRRHSRTMFASSLLATVALALAGCGGGSGDFPSDEITIIVPYSAGGPTDIAARELQPYFEEEFGVGVVVENLPGASGSVGQQEMVQRPSDGHTLQLVSSTAMSVVPHTDQGDHTLDDLAFIGAVSEFPSVIAASGGSELADPEAYFEQARNGEVTVGTFSPIAQGAIELERMSNEEPLNFTVVPYEGAANATTALLGGNVDSAFLVASDTLMPSFESGDLEPVAISAPERADYMEDVPTLEELGYEGIDMGTSYYGLAAHPETDQEIIERFESVLEEALQDPDTLSGLGEEYVPDEFVDGEELEQLYREQSDAYEPFVNTVNDD